MAKNNKKPELQIRHTTAEDQSAGGRAERPEATARGNQTPTQPENPATASLAASTETAHVSSGPARGSQKNLFNMAAAAVSEKVRLKSQLLSEVRQRLAEAADNAKKGMLSEVEAENMADTQAVRLFQARVSGVLSADELSGLLGDIFGYKPKSDGTPGKTPNGLGEVIRKRIVRSVQGYQHVSGQDGGRFFDGLPKDEVAGIISRLGAKDNPLTVWGAYKALSDLKSGLNNRVHPAFDPKRIAAIVEKLNEEGARAKIIASPTLQQAYGALVDTLAIVGQIDDDEAEEVEEALEAA